MEKIKNFETFINEMGDTNQVPFMSPIDYNCPNCTAKINMNIYEPGTNPVGCEECGRDFEYPWPSTSWRWV